MNKNLTHKELTHYLNYDPQTGIFTWRVSKNKTKPGDKAGYIDTSNEVMMITINGIRYKASHLAWLYVYKKFPKGRVYFIDGDRYNIRISNLKEGKTPIKVPKLINVLCPDCGDVRRIHPIGIKKSLLVGDLPEILCNLCARKAKRRQSKILIQVGNCFIKPGTKRCDKPDSSLCPNFGICLDIAAKKNWPGWKCVKIEDWSAKT